MDEERRCVEKLLPVNTSPLVSPGPILVTLFRHRVRRRGESEDVKNQGFVITLPTILDESTFRSPSMRYSDFPVLGPMPVVPGVDGLGEGANLALIWGVAIEILRRRQCSGDQKGRIDC